MFISSHCPTAAAACFSSIVSGRRTNPIFASPALTAPLLTSIIFFPEFCKSQSVFTSTSIRLRLSIPDGYVKVEVPTLTTIICASLISFILYLHQHALVRRPFGVKIKQKNIYFFCRLYYNVIRLEMQVFFEKNIVRKHT